jgi:aspartyl aminopeptidase
MRTVDLGVAQLAMHSARELCGSADPARLRDLLVELFNT